MMRTLKHLEWKLAISFLSGVWVIPSALAAGAAVPEGVTEVAPGYAAVAVSTLAGPARVVLPRQSYTFGVTARTFYVAKDGSDDHDGSAQRPWASIGHALQRIGPGDVLYVRGGDYPTPFAVKRSGAAQRPIVLSAHPGERVRIHQPPNWQKQNPHAATVTLDGARHVWLHGFQIEGCLGRVDAPTNDTYGQNGISLLGGAGEGVRILNNVVSRGQHCGIKELGHGGTRFLIEGNVVFDNGASDHRDHGIYIPSNEAVVRGNAIFRNKGYGIHLYEKPSRCHVYNNLCFANGEAGIIVSGANNTLAHNVCAGNRWAGLVLFRGGCRENVIVNNVFVHNRQSQVAMDNGGGRPEYGTPSDNRLDFSVIFPREKWASPESISAWMGGRTIFAAPVTGGATAALWDQRLRRGSPGLGQAGAVELNGAQPADDVGLFSANAYLDPKW